MIPYLKSLLYDADSFANFIRGGLFLAGEILKNTPTGELGWWAGQILQPLALFVRSSGKP